MSNNKSTDATNEAWALNRVHTNSSTPMQPVTIAGNNEKNLQEEKGQLIGVFNYDLKAGTETFIRANPLKDWTEDFEHENGNYQCLCISCQSYFLGYKRRNTCKECASTIPEVKAALPGGGEEKEQPLKAMVRSNSMDTFGLPFEELNDEHKILILSQLCDYLYAREDSSTPPASKTLQECQRKFTYFPNHGDEDGRNCYTICFGDPGDDSFDEVIVGAEDTEEDAQEAVSRLNAIFYANQLQARGYKGWNVDKAIEQLEIELEHNKSGYKEDATFKDAYANNVLQITKALHILRHTTK